ncbi:MAG: formylglycine-generating enzyme family protein [Pseudomonadota bacterium]
MTTKRHIRLEPYAGRLAALLIVLISGAAPVWAQTGDSASSEGSAAPGAAPERRPARLGDSLAVDPGQEWTPGTQSPADRSDELRRKLSLGRNALDAGNLLTPFDASALNYFRQALAVDPGNAEAEAGLDTLAQRLIDSASQQLAAGNRRAARATATTVSEFRPRLPALAALRDQLDRTGRLEALTASLAEAQTAGVLLMPLESSALGVLDQMLLLDPQNAAALAGAESLLSSVSEQVLAAAQSDDYQTAFELLDLTDSAAAATESQVIDPAQLVALREQVTARQADGWRSDLAELERLLADDELAQVEQGLTALASTGYPGDLQPLQARVERRRLILSYEPGSIFADNLGTGISGPSMVVIPSGRFFMGSPAGEEGRNEREGPTREITFDLPFALARTEITVAQFAAFVAATGYQTAPERGGASQVYDGDSGGFSEASVTFRDDFSGDPADGDLPAIHVSWDDASAYARWLSEQTGQSYRLPSEAEFEYAQRAGTTDPYYWGEGSPPDALENLTGARDQFRDWSWPNAFSRYGDGFWGPAPAASFQPNPWNVHDLGGNVLEWTADCFEDSLENTPIDGRAWQVRPCSNRSLRGGGWAVAPTMARSASRASASAQRASPLVGFRVARDL